MKRLLFAVAVGLSATAFAADLQEAERLLGAKAYDKAFPIYAELARSGDINAEFRLGEMYWYGQGTTADLKAATDWLQKAASRGHPGAAESLRIMKERESRGADIAYWTSGYQGEELVRLDCPAPAIPVLSETKSEIRKTAEAYVRWQQCYNGFVAKLNDVMPIGKHVPADVVRLLTPGEAEQVGAHLGRVFGSRMMTARQEAEAITAKYNAWLSSTEAYVKVDKWARDEENAAARRIVQERMEQHQPRPYRPATPPTPPRPAPAPGPNRSSGS